MVRTATDRSRSRAPPPPAEPHGQRSRRSPAQPLRQAGDDLSLQPEHLSIVGLVVVTAEMEHAVHRGHGEVSAVRWADDDVAQLLEGPPRLRPRRSERTVRRSAVLIGGGADSTPGSAAVDELPAPDARQNPDRGECRRNSRRGRPMRRDRGRETHSDEPCLSRSRHAPSRCRRRRRCAARAMRSNVVAAEANEGHALDPVEDLPDDDEPERWWPGRSKFWVMSPVTTTASRTRAG